MVQKVKPQELNVTIKFGGGLHTRASADEIDQREAAAGYNFLLDLDNRELRPRAPFDLVGTLPNGGSVLGGASLLNSSGTVSTLFQGAGIVYEWDGSDGFTQVGTCNSSSKLRGHWRSHNWVLSDKVLITDLTLNDVVKEWDGTTFQSVSFLDVTDSFGTFYAKYCDINNERAFFANVKDPTGTYPHLMVGSKLDDYATISTTDVPASSLATSDPFYMVSPDLKPINGLVGAFGRRIISTEKGSLFNLAGSDAQDFAFNEFFAGSGASGAESLVYIGNDIIYGRQGRIESVRDTSSFGNSEADDLSLEIADQIESYTGWTNVFNSRLNRVYLFPTGQSEVWVFNTAFRTQRTVESNALAQIVQQLSAQQNANKFSPWMRWQTDHALAFTPTFVMPMLDPSDGLEYTFMGDGSGNVYRTEGTGTSGDGGTTDLATSWTTKVFSAPLDADVYEIEGFIKYKKNLSATVTLTLLAAGRTAFDNSITISLPAVTQVNYWGDTVYFGEDIYFGAAFQSRLIRQPFKFAGQASDFQIRVDVSGVNTFNINSISLRMKAASQ